MKVKVDRKIIFCYYKKASNDAFIVRLAKQTKEKYGGAMEFPFLSQLPEALQLEAWERLTLKTQLSEFFPGLRIRVGLPQDGLPSGNGGYSASVFDGIRKVCWLSAGTSTELLHQARANGS